MTLRMWLSLLDNVRSPWAKLPACIVDPTNPDGPSRAGFWHRCRRGRDGELLAQCLPRRPYQHTLARASE